MIQIVSKSISFLSTFTAFYFLISADNSSAVNIGLFIAAALTIFLLVIDLINFIKHKDRSFNRTTEKGKADIAAYLVKQLTSSGSIDIFSKDLTWVKKHSEAERLLLDKAKAKELTLFIQENLPIADQLKMAGANVFLYGGQKKKGFSPKSRFTILDRRAGKTRIMVGIPAGDKHLINHYGSDDSEVVDLAQDFICLLECVSSKQ